jgi:hypothetical protein
MGGGKRPQRGLSSTQARIQRLRQRLELETDDRKRASIEAQIAYLARGRAGI